MTPLIYAIPPEILGHIFTLIVPGKVLTIPSSSANALFQAAQICSSWRAIALQHPHLWSDLDIRLHSWSDWGAIQAARLCLQYSAKAYQPPPLSIRLQVRKYINHWTSHSGIHAPDFLIPHAHRIRKLSVLSPLLLTPLILPHLIDLEVLAPGMEARPDMHIPALLRRSGSTLTRLSVGYILDWRALLEYTPQVEKLITEGTISEEIMREIANGRLGAALKEVSCAVALHDCDVFLDMLEARAQAGVDLRVGVCAITNIEARCMDFCLNRRQWSRIHTLAPGVQVVITEG